MKLLYIIITVILISCSSQPATDIAGGSSSETTSGIVVSSSVHSIYGKAQSGTKLILCETSYTPYHDTGFRDSAMVSSDKKYAFENLTSGYYNLIAIDTLTGEGVFIGDIDTEEESKVVRRSFSAPGTVVGKISPSTTENNVIILGGTPFYSTPDENGEFQFFQIPSGTYQLQLEQKISIDSSGGETFTPHKINVLPDSTVAWKE